MSLELFKNLLRLISFSMTSDLWLEGDFAPGGFFITLRIINSQDFPSIRAWSCGHQGNGTPSFGDSDCPPTWSFHRMAHALFILPPTARQLQVWSMDQLEATLLRGADGIIVLNWFEDLKRLVPTGE
ncbi:hypothetical protein MYX65_05770 [Acidobacteria bacterium AH-259-L09]|nr:hypothetical protein [Acidobacteria bacterium AH-259-L09]